MIKFGRNYALQVEASDSSMVTIEYPLTIEFAIRRANLASANQGTFRVYNLGQDARNKLFHDRIDYTL